MPNFGNSTGIQARKKACCIQIGAAKFLMVGMGSTADFHCLHGIRTVRPMEGFAAYRERGGAKFYGWLRVPGWEGVPADSVKSAGLSSRVADGVVEPQRLPC